MSLAGEMLDTCLARPSDAADQRENTKRRARRSS
jgi:hypothetical protein